MAASALWRFADKRAVPGLIKLLSDPEHNVRNSAAHALGRIAPHEAVEPLIQTLSDPELFVRETAAEALSKIGSHKAVGPLIACLEQESPAGLMPGRWGTFRNRVVEALETITGRSFGKLYEAPTDAQRQEIIHKWLEWWQENKDQYEARRKSKHKAA